MKPAKGFTLHAAFQTSKLAEVEKQKLMFKRLEEINTRPEVFSVYTADALWVDEHRSKQMLSFHLNETIDVSSRNMQFIEQSSAWITEKFQLAPGKSVCDFGCGPGLYTSRFANSGAHVTGLDFSGNSIRFAQHQADQAKKDIEYVQVDYLNYETTDRFDLITIIMCDFCALSPGQRALLLTKFRDLLKEGGAVLLDVYSMAAYAERNEVSFYEKNQLNHFWCEEDYYCFVNTFKYDADAVVLDKYTVFPENCEDETVYNWLQYFSPQSLGKELLDAGFKIEDTYMNVSGRPFSEQHSEFAVVAVKQAG